MSSPALAIQLSEAEMRLLQTLVYQECGMYFDARRAHFLQDRLQRRLRECRTGKCRKQDQGPHILRF